MPEDQVKSPPRPRGRWRRWLGRLGRLTWNALAVLGIVLLTWHLLFGLEWMNTSSMAPTLMGEDRGQADQFLVERISTRLRNPHRWEIMHLRLSDGTPVAKRVVGLPGEKIAINKQGQVVINGEPQIPPRDVSFLKYLPCGNLGAGQVMDIPSNSFFVMGDDADSFDSRFDGPVPRARIDGRVVMRTWPWGRIGWIVP